MHGLLCGGKEGCEMRLWVDTEALNSAGRVVRAKVNEMKIDVNRKVLSRGTRALNELRNAELEVLRGPRGGKVYKKPGTYGKPNKRTRKLMGDYGHKLRDGQLYTASAPGEPPAKRNGDLRLHWNGEVKGGVASGGGTSITVELESQEHYAGYLEDGTSKMEPRPFAKKIKEKAAPGIDRIFSEPYF